MCYLLGFQFARTAAELGTERPNWAPLGLLLLVVWTLLVLRLPLCHLRKRGGKPETDKLERKSRESQVGLEPKELPADYTRDHIHPRESSTPLLPRSRLPA